MMHNNPCLQRLYKSKQKIKYQYGYNNESQTVERPSRAEAALTEQSKMKVSRWLFGDTICIFLSSLRANGSPLSVLKVPSAKTPALSHTHSSFSTMDLSRVGKDY